MGDTGWEVLDLKADPAAPGRFTTYVSDNWVLGTQRPIGGVVAAVAGRAMAEALARPELSLRSISAVFAAPVHAGDVEVDVTVLRQGRSMSQATATVRNVGADAGLTAVAVFGTSRRGYAFTELRLPDVPGPEGLRSFRDPVPEGIDFEFDAPLMPYWERVVDCRPALGRAPWEPFEDGPAETAYWYRLEAPPVMPGHPHGEVLDPAAAVVLCDMMPGAVGQKLGPDRDDWFGPSADLTVHLLGPATPGWLLVHNRARHAGDGYASADAALWDPRTHTLVAYATQVMFFVMTG
jgi:acyl-CoA thioesterase